MGIRFDGDPGIVTLIGKNRRHAPERFGARAKAAWSEWWSVKQSAGVPRADEPTDPRRAILSDVEHHSTYVGISDDMHHMRIRLVSLRSPQPWTGLKRRRPGHGHVHRFLCLYCRSI